jgi:hypothetical protein
VRLPPAGRRHNKSKSNYTFPSAGNDASFPRKLHNAIVEADTKSNFQAASERYHGKVVSVKLVKGTIEKRSILEAYEQTFNLDPSTSIVARKKGKTDVSSNSCVRMRISSNRYYRVDS